MDMNNTMNSTANYTAQQEEIVIWVSILASIMSFSYNLSYAIFHKEMSKKTSNEILNYIFWSNTLTSLGSVVGLPSDFNAACWWEGIMTNIFTLSSILWTVVLTLLLFSIIGFQQPIKVAWYYHVICWLIPIFFTFIPLINVTYGPPDGQGWCWTVPLPNTPNWAMGLWYWLNYYLWLWLSFIAIVTLGILSILKLRNASNLTLKNFKRAFFSLAGYPLVILICWLPGTVTDYISVFYPDYDFDPTGNFSYSTSVIGTADGCLAALVFWIADSNVRTYWYEFATAGFSLKIMEENKRKKRSGGNTHSSDQSNDHSERTSEKSGKNSRIIISLTEKSEKHKSSSREVVSNLYSV